LILGKNDFNLLRDADCNLILDKNRVEVKIKKDEL